MTAASRLEEGSLFIRRAGRWGMAAIALSLCIAGASSAMDLSRFPLVVSAGTHSLTVPWHPGPVTNRLNPALIIGTEHTLRPGERWRLYHTANIGFFQHYWWMTGVSLDMEFGAGCALWRGLHADMRLGVGYLHYFWRRKTLELKDGTYVQATAWGRPSVLLPLSLVVGYRGITDNPFSISPFVAARWAVQTPFIDETPAMTHLTILVGARFEWGRSTAMDGR